MPHQRSFDELGTPLRDVTFCVLDVETTGASAATEHLTEIGAVKVRGGEWLGTFHTLVNPGGLIPPQITVLTGITHAMVQPAPKVEAVLGSLVEFMAGTVLVGHNIRFDVSFLNAALERASWPRLRNPVVDTCALARRLVRDEVPNCRLDTLASRLRLDHRPRHRALEDALATTDLLHLLLERAASFGVLGLDDLLELPRLGGHPQVAKLRLTTALPRGPGVYWFVGQRDEVLYVGKATNLRQRVRSYFSGDDRRMVGALLREAKGIGHLPCRTTLDAAVNEVRLIHHHRPRYNRVGKRWQSYAYLALTLKETFPRLTVARRPYDDGNLYLGPLPSTAVARTLIDAVHTALPLRRCSRRIGRVLPAVDGECTPAQLGVALCPCSGTVGADAYAAVVDSTVRGLTSEPELLLGPLRSRMDALAANERFEEAADVRRRASALANALRRQRRLESLRTAGTIRLVLGSGGGAEVRHGLLERTWLESEAGQPELPLADEPAPDRSAVGPLPTHLADEVSCIAAWLESECPRIRLEHCDGTYCSPVRPVPSFEPGRAR
jgi:DNA polymerase-3 subunit epsilon